MADESDVVLPLAAVGNDALGYEIVIVLGGDQAQVEEDQPKPILDGDPFFDRAPDYFQADISFFFAF